MHREALQDGLLPGAFRPQRPPFLAPPRRRGYAAEAVTVSPHPLPLLVWPLAEPSTLAAAAARVTDWPRLIEQAGHEGLLGLLAARLTAARPSGVPREAMAELGRLRRLSAQRNLRMTGQLVRILELLERHGVEALPVKGPALAQDLYGDPTVRMSCDLDVLVRPRDAAAARRLLLGSGFEDEGSYNERLLRREAREGEVHLRRRDGEPMVDLHWRLTVGHSAREISADRLLAGARTIRLLGREVRSPGEADQLLLTALHGARHEWRPLELRLAVAVQVARLSAAAWPGLCAAARELGCLRRLLVGVAYACRPFPVAVPAEVLRGLACDPVAPGYARYLCRTAGGAGGAAGGADGGAGDGRRRALDHLATLWWRVRSEDRGRDAFDHLVMRGLLPSPEDWDAMHLPALLEWLYWPLRPARLLAKYARQAVRER